MKDEVQKSANTKSMIKSYICNLAFVLSYIFLNYFLVFFSVWCQLLNVIIR